MSRAPVQPAATGRRPSAALALHRVRDACRFVLATGGGGATLRVTEAGSIPASDDKALEALLQRAGSGALVVQVVPPQATILRPAPPKLVLDGTPEQVAAALALVAEAELPGSVPPHRRCAGVLRIGHAHAVYAIGWIGPEGDLVPGATPLPGAPALAALFRLTGAPSGLLVYTDRPTGVVALLGAAGAAAGESPTLLVRILKDDATDADAFDAVRDEAVADANDALAFQTPVPLLQVGEALRFPRRPQVAGLSGDDRISEFALALGAAAFALDARPDELPLLAMSDRSPTAGRTLVARVRESFSTPRALAVTAVACLSLLLTGWILAAPARLAILQKRVGDDTGDYTKAVQQHDWYHALHERRWPMTALMAELTATAPEGVRVESLTIEQGRPITLAGSAPTSEDVYAWCKSLRGRVFSEVVPTIPQEDASPVRFTLRADVADALAAAAGDLKPIAASDTPHPHADQPRSDRAERPDRPGRSTTPRPVPTQGRSTTTRSGTSTSPASAGAPSAEVPPAMTEAQIDKLAIGPATIEWARRKGQLARSDLEPTVRARLQHELQHLEARRKALGGGQ